jgi:RNA polymerase sigma-70 factor, ECF subfamily
MAAKRVTSEGIRAHSRSSAGHGSEREASAIARAKDGDRDALHFLYVRYADHVHACVQRIVRDPHEAQDLTQTVFTKLIRVIANYEDRGLPFSAWLGRVARNTALDHVRASRMVPCEEVFTGADHSREVATERLSSLREALAQLPEAQREVLVLRHIAGLSPTEIAERLGKSEGSVHGLHHRARGAFVQTLRDLDAAPVTAKLSA